MNGKMMVRQLEPQHGIKLGIKYLRKIWMIPIFLIHCFCLPITSCVREEMVDVNYENLQAKLSVQCYLCPRFDTISVLVTQTVPWAEWLDSHEFNAKYGVLNAVVKLSGGNKDWVELTKDTSMFSEYSIPTSEIPIVKGQKYFIEVSAPGFETVTGSTTVPDTLAFWSAIDTIRRYRGSHEGGGYHIKMNFKGEWQEVDEDFGYSVIHYHLSDIEKYDPPTHISGYGYSFAQDIRQYGTNYIVFTDAYLYSSDFPGPPRRQRSYFYIITGNSDFYDYQQAIAPYLNDDYDAGDMLGSSFFNTIVPRYYTNLSGGYGIFSAFRYAVDSIDLIQ